MTGAETRSATSVALDGDGGGLLEDAVDPLVEDDVVFLVLAKLHVVEVARVGRLVHQLPLAGGAELLVLLFVQNINFIPLVTNVKWNTILL